MSLNLGKKAIFSKYYKTVSFLLTGSLIPPPAGNEISSYAAYEKRNIRIIIQVKPEALISCSETGVTILLLLLLIFSLSTTEQNACPPGWLNWGESCFRILIKSYHSWEDAMFECQNHGGRLPVLGNTTKLHAFSRSIDDYEEDLGYFSIFFVGAHIISDGRWITVRKQLFPAQSLQWGTSQPSGDGWCTDLIFEEKWNSKGWRINDQNCLSKEGFVCEKPKNTSGNNI